MGGMDVPAQPPILDYHRPTRRRFSWYALAAPLVAVAAMLLSLYVGGALVTRRYLTVGYLFIYLCPLGSIAYSVYAHLRIRRSRGELLGRTVANLAILFSIGTGLMCPVLYRNIDEARRVAVSTKTSLKMKYLCNAWEKYANDHGGQFPPHSAALLTAGLAQPDG
jgi:hypothetical protein